MVVRQIVNSIFSSNTFLITENGVEDVWLVDCGDADRILSALQPDQRICGILLTHTHFDHIYGLNTILESYPQCMVYTNSDGDLGLKSAKKNFSFYHEKSFIFNYSNNIKLLDNGERVPIFLDTFINPVFTPGHAFSCITYSIGDFLFTGDSYIPGCKPVTNLKGGDKQLYKESVNKIIHLMTEQTIICPGHGEMSHAVY